jgi:hypothetical protein
MNRIGRKTARACRNLIYRHPMELAWHARVSPRRKRDLLLAWADAANADPENPALRRDPNSGVSARPDEIAEALTALQEDVARRESTRRAPARPRLQPARVNLVAAE